MNTAVPIRIVLIKPPAGVCYGIQRGKGSKYTVDLAQVPKRGDVTFDFTIEVTEKSRQPDFRGQYIQGTPARRFIYVDVGTYAGQQHTQWSRRMIVLLNGITREQVNRALTPGHRLSARVEGTGKDGGPSCATVPIIDGWKVIKFA